MFLRDNQSSTTPVILAFDLAEAATPSLKEIDH